MLESISAAGDTMKPLVIHRGTAPDKPLDRWFPPSQECPHWRWGFTAKGWTNDEHAIEWLKEVFIPQSRRGRDPDDASYWRLLIIDGHGSHTRGEFIFEYLINQVLIAYLLPHTSHLSQPCDLGPFVHLKSKLLSFEVSKARKRTLEDEVQETTKRLRKQDDKRTWDTTEIFKARGYTAEETAGYMDVLPNRALIYNVEEEPNT